MTHEVEIVGLSRGDRSKPNQGGETIVAAFDVKANGIILRGCVLVRSSSGEVVVWPPNVFTGSRPGDRPKQVTIADGSLRRNIKEAALTAYRALGGTEVEWAHYQEQKS